jgi:hypothetical protein
MVMVVLRADMASTMVLRVDMVPITDTLVAGAERASDTKINNLKVRIEVDLTCPDLIGALM